MVDLYGHEAGNGGYSQRTPNVHWGSSTRRRSWSEIFRSQSSPDQSAAQIVFGIAVLARQTGTAQAQNFPDLGSRCMLGEQLCGQPEIDDAPIGLREALANAPTLKPALIHGRRAFGRDAAVWWRSRPELLWCGNGRSRRIKRRRWLGVECKPFLGGIEHFLRGGGQDGLSMHDLDRRRDTRERACRWLEIAKAGQTAQVAPIGAGPVAAIALGQDSAQSRGQCRLQRRGADPDPSLEVARTGLEHDTGLMPVDAHLLEHVRAGVIQVEEDVARVAPFGVRPEVYVEAQAVVCAQKTHYSVVGQLMRGPQPLSRSWSTSDRMDQANHVNLIRHRRQLATDGLLGEEFAVEHAAKHELGACFPTTDFQWMVTSALTTCLTSGDNSRCGTAFRKSPGRTRNTPDWETGSATSLG
jgi:hypothetical protein